VGKTDFARALEIERGIKYRNPQWAAMRVDAVRLWVANALAKTAPGKAMRLARGSTVPHERARVAYALAKTAPDKAMRLARSITDPAERARAVWEVTLADVKRSEKRLRRASGKLLAFARAMEPP
jgi:hypothetical protein